MHIKNLIVSLFVWASLILALLMTGDAFISGKDFRNFSKVEANSKDYNKKESIIFAKVNNNLVCKNEDSKEIRIFCTNIDKITNYNDLKAILEIIKEEAQEINLSDEIEAESYSNYLTSKTVIVAVILGFLSIFFVIKIEWDRLQNERNHYREQAKDNVSDILNFSMNLMEEIDRKHVDFMYSLGEIKAICTDFKLEVLIDPETLKVMDEKKYLRKLYTIDTTDLKNNNKLSNILNPKFESYSQHNIYYTITFLKNLIKLICIPFKFIHFSFLILFSKYNLFGITLCKNEDKFSQYQYTILNNNIRFSIAFIRLLISDEKLRDEFGCTDCLDKLKLLYYSTISKNYDEYLENSGDVKSHSINEEVKKISNHIEEIILKKDFEITDEFSKKYLDIVDSIKNFENMIEGKVIVQASGIQIGDISEIVIPKQEVSYVKQ
jgi:hypothetical protein